MAADPVLHPTGFPELDRESENPCSRAATLSVMPTPWCTYRCTSLLPFLSPSGRVCPHLAGVGKCEVFEVMRRDWRNWRVTREMGWRPRQGSNLRPAV